MAQEMLKQIQKVIEGMMPQNRAKSLATIEQILASKDAKKYILQSLDESNAGYTILHWIIEQAIDNDRRRASYLVIIKLLINTNAKILQIGESMKNDLPLHKCILNGLCLFLQELITDENINARNKDGKTALHLVCELVDKSEAWMKSRMAMFEILLSNHNIDINCLSGGLLKQTPLFACLSFYKNRKEIIDTLIKRKAVVELPITDITKNITLTAMHHAVTLCLYDELKILLRSCATCNPRDSNGETPLHYAVREYQTLYQRFQQNKHNESDSDSHSDDESSSSASDNKELMNAKDIIYLLLKQNTIDISTKNTSGQEAVDLTEDPEMKKLISTRRRSLEFLKLSKARNGEIIWVKSLNFNYERRPSRNSHAPSITENNHFYLKQSENAVRANKGNTATSGLTFILKRSGDRSDASDNVRLEWIELTTELNLSTKDKEALETNANKRITMAKELFAGIFSPRQINKSETMKPIVEHKAPIKRNHSEQFIIEALINSNNRKSIIKKLVNRLGNNSRIAEEYTVLGITIHIHSERYCCPNCQVALLGAQHNDGLKNDFIKDLKDTGFEIKPSHSAKGRNELKMSVFVTAEDPYTKKEQSEEKRFTEEDHQDISIDLHSLSGAFIFAKDIKQIAAPAIPFHSNAQAKAGTVAKEMEMKDETIKKLKEKEKAQEAEINRLKDAVAALRIRPK